MPLGVRDMLLILRASDQASHTIANVGRSIGTLSGATQQQALRQISMGQSLIALGAGITAIGVGIGAFYGSSAKAAMEYNRQAALTLTQVDQVGVSLDKIKQIGIEVARAIPAPFKEMQTTLYDIFSSMDVNVDGAKHLLTQFAKAAVAGQTDVQAAGRATISIMNAFKIPVEQVGRVMDVQFETVRKGVITYEEFASTIGRAIPSAVRAGQSIENLGGMIAFLTRNGLSAAMSATSAARALDLFSNPKFIGNMRDIGVAVTDAEGNFRPLNVVVGELREKFRTLSPEEKTNALKELTMGAGGTIQAMRFLNLAVGENGQLLDELTGHVSTASGAMEDAYNIMADQGATKLQALKNAWETLRVEVGDLLLPVITKVVEVGTKILNWFNDLDPGLQRIIVGIGSLIGVGTILFGILTVMAGAFLLLSGTLTLLGLSLGGVVLAGGIIVAVLIAIGIAIFLAIKYWDEIKAVVLDVWARIVEMATGVWNTFLVYWGQISAFVAQVWDFIWEKITGVLGPVVEFIAEQVQKIVDWVRSHWEAIQQATENVWNAIWATIDIAWTIIWGIVSLALELIISIIQTGWNIAWEIISFVMGLITDGLRIGWQIISSIIEIAWELIKGVIETALDIILGIVGFFINILAGDWRAAWNDIWNMVKNILGNVVGTIRGMMGEMVEAAWDVGRSIVTGIINGIKSLPGAVFDAVKGLVGGAIDLGKKLIGFGSPSKVFMELGHSVGQGYTIGINEEVKAAHRATQRLMGVDNSGSPSGSVSGGVGTQNAYINIDIKDARDPEAVAAVVDDRLQEFLREWRRR